MSTFTAYLSTLTHPLVIVCVLVGVPILSMSYLLVKSINVALFSTDRDQAEQARLLATLLLNTLSRLLGRGGDR